MPKRQRIIFFTGLALYAISFLLLAVSFASIFIPPLRGWECAEAALLLPWDSNPLSKGVFAWAALLLSGLINPAFLLAAILIWRQRARHVVLTLAVAILVMIPFCWIVFRNENLHPREGYFLWILGMILVLFSGFLSQRIGLPAAPAESQNTA